MAKKRNVKPKSVKKNKVENKKPAKKQAANNKNKKTSSQVGTKKSLKEKFVSKKEKAEKKGLIKKRKTNSKSVKKSDFQKKFEAKKEKAEKEGLIKQSTGGEVTIHDAKTEMITFFKYEDKKRKDKKEVREWEAIKKALYAFNKIVRKKRIQLEEEASSGKNTKKNYEILQNKSSVELKVSKDIRETLVNNYPRIFKQREFLLKEIPYGYATNKINYYSGKDFYFIIDSGFKKHFVTKDEIKRQTVLTSKSFAAYLLNIFEKDFNESLTYKVSKNYSKKELKIRERVYDKIRNVIAYNREIIFGEATKLYEKKQGGQSANWRKNIKRDDGKYPILFSLLEELITLSVS